MSDFFSIANWELHIVVLVSTILFFTAPYILVVGFILYAVFSNANKPKQEKPSTFFRDKQAKYEDKSLADFDFQALLDTDGQFMSTEDKLAYMYSIRWSNIKSIRLKLDNNQCQLCGTEHNLEIHHITYTRLGNELVTKDVVTLCRFCHQSIHDKLGYDRTTLYPIK